jgi:hypothetical protein
MAQFTWQADTGIDPGVDVVASNAVSVAVSPMSEHT